MHLHMKIKPIIGVQVTRVYSSSYFVSTPLGSLTCPVENTNTQALALMSHPKDGEEGDTEKMPLEYV